jgi:acetyl-CoA C-acetyltransferase
MTAGAATTVLSVGSENMPRTPHLAPGLRRGVRLGPITLIDSLFELGYRVSAACSATAPRDIAVIPAGTIQKVLERAGLSLEEMELFEINEAFAAMPLVSTKLLVGGDPGRWRALQEKTNVNGGAIAIGHPVGASAGRLVMTLAFELKRRGGGYGVASICGGLAQGEAVILKV